MVIYEKAALQIQCCGNQYSTKINTAAKSVFLNAAVYNELRKQIIMIENEFKLMLDCGQYEKLLTVYKFKTFVQTNHYYDTDDLSMSAKSVTIRVRDLDDKHFLQMKLPTGKSYSRIELSTEIPDVPENIPSEKLSSLLNSSAFDFPDVKLLGALKTTRNVYKFDGGEVDLDKSEYFGKIDYEAEIEFTNETAARKILHEIKETLNINPQSDVCTGKIHRFLEEYRSGRHG